MATILTLIGVADAKLLGDLLPPYEVIQQMADTYGRVRLGQKSWKAIIQRAALIIKELHGNSRKNRISVPDMTELQKRLEEIQTMLQELANMSFFKALLRFEDVNGWIERANRLLDDCQQLFRINPSLGAQSQNKAAISDRDALRALLKILTGDYGEIRRRFAINNDEQEDRAVVVLERAVTSARTTSEGAPIEVQIMKTSLECLKATTGMRGPKHRKWLITEFDLDFCGTIGGGRFSTVSKARFRGTMVAVKTLRDIGNLREALEREIEIWSRLRYDHIVPFYGASTLTPPPYIVSRYMRNGNLVQYLLATPDVDRTRLILEVSLGMYYLHEEVVVHGDLKGVNVLVDDAGKACITDFGLSPLCSGVAGTLRYLAPEALRGQPLCFETDVYAFGMLIYEVFTGEIPFVGEPDELVLEGLVRLHRPTSRRVSECGFNDALWKLLSDCISREPTARPRFNTIQTLLYSMKKVESSAQLVHPGTGGIRSTDLGHDTGSQSDLGYDTGHSIDWELDKANQVISDLRSDLEVASQTISTLRSDLAAAQKEARVLKGDYDFQCNRFQHDRSDLRSALGTQTAAVAKAKETMSTLQSELEVAREEVKTAERNTRVACAALDALKIQVTRANDRLVPGIGAFQQWMSEAFVGTDRPTLDGDLSSSSSDTYNMLAYKAVMKVRLKHWSSAYEDAKKSIDIQPSAMGYTAVALAQSGNGGPEDATQAFDLVFKNCNPGETNLLLLIKAIVLFVAGEHDNAISRVHDLITVSKDDEILFCYIQVLGKMYLMQRNYARAVQSLKLAHGVVSSCADPYLEIISFVFDWTFDGLQITVQRYYCEELCATGRVEEATEALLDAFGEDIRASKITTGWVIDLTKKCVDMLEVLGDQALDSGKHDEAIAHYTSALSLSPPNPVDILVKRSKAYASKRSWEHALLDANEVVKLDPSSHQGHERKFAALHGAENYGDAYNALFDMFSNIGNSTDEASRRLREKYTTHEIVASIDMAVHEISNLCPLVLIDVTTGKLHDAQQRIRIFKSETPFKKLVCEASIMKMDRTRIRQSVAQYFKWIMFSHTWEGKEPTFKDVNLVDSVWKLDESPLNEKLRQFCKTASEDGYRWAWSDTCCIDKSTSAVLSQSLTSMYSWYEEAAATLVYLADVLSSAELGDLTKSRWMTRAWTLQELLASKVVRFYNREWKLYLNDARANHKESPAIKQELANAMGVAPETITGFRPEDLGVREKLRLASIRNATVEEDIAYSLIGIFSSDIAPRYGLGKIAIGQLLENIVARTGDATVIAWTGKSLPYNSALPDSLEVYSRTPYSPPPMNASELDTRVEELRSGLPLEDVLVFYRQVIQLPRATFSNRCLQLPCIAFTVTKIGIQDASGNQGLLYNAIVPSLGKVEFRTADAITLTKPRKLVLVHPWLRDLHDPHDEFVSDDEAEIESNSGFEASEATGGESDADSDASASTAPLHAEPLAQLDRHTSALRLIARLERPFNALLLERQSNGQYKRIAAEHEIILPGAPYQTNPKNIRARVFEVV